MSRWFVLALGEGPLGSGAYARGGSVPGPSGIRGAPGKRLPIRASAADFVQAEALARAAAGQHERSASWMRPQAARAREDRKGVLLGPKQGRLIQARERSRRGRQ